MTKKKLTQLLNRKGWRPAIAIGDFRVSRNECKDPFLAAYGRTYYRVDHYCHSNKTAFDTHLEDSIADAIELMELQGYKFEVES